MFLLKLISIRTPTSNTTYLATDASNWRCASCSTNTIHVVFIAPTISDRRRVWCLTQQQHMWLHSIMAFS